jgi:hypothetical protein
LPPYLDVIISGPLPLGFSGDINVRNGTGAALTITLPASPVLGQALRFKDVLGNASTWPIIISGAIDGSGSYSLYQNYAAVELYWSGSQWSVR